MSDVKERVDVLAATHGDGKDDLIGLAAKLIGVERGAIYSARWDDASETLTARMAPTDDEIDVTFTREQIMEPV